MLDIEGLGGIIAARKASDGCEYCSGEGLATIFHVDYDGSCAYVIEFFSPPRGERKRLTRTVAYCVCAAGRWIMFEHQTNAKDIFARITDLHTIIQWEKSGCLWSTRDPNAQQTDPDEPTTWAELNRRIASGERPGIRLVHPRYEGNRSQAYREMAYSSPANGAPCDANLSSRSQIDQDDEPPF